MQSGLRWGRSPSRRRSPVACAPYAPPSARPCRRAATWASVRRCARCSGQWPAASHNGLAPAHPSGASPLRGFGPCAQLARPPPRGAPSSARQCGAVAPNSARRFRGDHPCFPRCLNISRGSKMLGHYSTARILRVCRESLCVYYCIHPH
jgi:hypothetical protein